MPTLCAPRRTSAPTTLAPATVPQSTDDNLSDRAPADTLRLSAIKAF